MIDFIYNHEIWDYVLPCMLTSFVIGIPLYTVWSVCCAIVKHFRKRKACNRKGGIS